MCIMLVIIKKKECTLPIWCDTSDRYSGPLNMISGIDSQTVYIEKHLLEYVKFLNESQYFKELVFTVVREKGNGP